MKKSGIGSLSLEVRVLSPKLERLSLDRDYDERQGSKNSNLKVLTECLYLKSMMNPFCNSISGKIH